jgi:hypothetical protein
MRIPRNQPQSEPMNQAVWIYFQGQWESALSDLKDAAIASEKVTVEDTEAWAVQHGDNGSHVFGFHAAEGDFRTIASVSSPHALRNLRSALYGWKP